MNQKTAQLGIPSDSIRSGSALKRKATQPTCNFSSSAQLNLNLASKVCLDADSTNAYTRSMQSTVTISPGLNALQPSLCVIDLRSSCLDQALNEIRNSNESKGTQFIDSLTRGLEETGVVIVRLPSADCDDAALENAHVLIAQSMGQLMRQNRAGDRTIRVRDEAPANAETARGFLSNSAMKLHTDGWDAAGLLCLQPAQKGGESLFVRSQTVYERIRELRPDLAPMLLDDWECDVRVLCDDPARPPLKSPVFALENDRLYCRYGSYILRNGAQAGGNILSSQRLELLDLFDAVTAEPDIQRCVTMARGDAIWMNNRTILHGRKAFSDNGTKGRNLMRIWLRLPKLSQPSESFLHFDVECFGTN